MPAAASSFWIVPVASSCAASIVVGTDRRVGRRLQREREAFGRLDSDVARDIDGHRDRGLACRDRAVEGERQRRRAGEILRVRGRRRYLAARSRRRRSVPPVRSTVNTNAVVPLLPSFCETVSESAAKRTVCAAGPVVVKAVVENGTSGGVPSADWSPLPSWVVQFDGSLITAA